MTRNRILVAVGLVVGVLIAIFIVLSIILSARDYAGAVSRLSASQSELAKVSEFAVNHDSASPSTKNFAITLLTVANSSVNLLKPIDGGSNIPSSIIKETADITSQVSLSSAAEVNDFNEKFVEIITTKLTDVASQASALSGKVKTDQKPIIDSIYEDYQLLLSALET